MSSAGGHGTATPVGGRVSLRSRATWTTAAVLFGVVPIAVLVTHFSDVILTSTVGYDFRVYYDAAKALREGGTPYLPLDATVNGEGYVYPPLTAVVVLPLTVLQPDVVSPLVMALLVIAVLAIPYVLGVRNWLCYGVMLLWPPIIQGIQTSNVTILMGLAAALAWRFRGRAVDAGIAVGSAAAAKFVLWPVAVWLAATRRQAAVAWAAACALVLVLAPWAAIGFDGLGAYPGLLRRFSAFMDDRAYSLYAVGLDLGAPSPVARLLWFGVALALLTGVVLTGRRGDDRTSFVLAIAATLSVSPVVWLPYFALLLVVVAVTQPEIGPLWFVPLAMWGTAGSYDPTAFETAGTVAVAAATVALAIFILRHEAREKRALRVEPHSVPAGSRS